MHQSFRSVASLSLAKAGRERKSSQKRSNEPSYWSRSARTDSRKSGR